MRVYLVRHGKASKDPQHKTDAERPLAERGDADVKNMAKILVKANVEVHQIRHSGLVRAAQTAEILGNKLKPPGGVIAVRGLHYADPVEPLARELRLETEPVMLVGHNPFMENLVSALLVTNMGRTPVWFATSTICCMDYINGEWSIKWVLHRELFG